MVVACEESKGKNITQRERDTFVSRQRKIIMKKVFITGRSQVGTAICWYRNSWGVCMFFSKLDGRG